MAVQADANHIVARFDVERIPIEVVLESGLGFIEQINASRSVFVAVIRDLYFVADVRRSAVGVPFGALCVLRARSIPDRNAAIAAPAQPELDVKVVLSEVFLGIQPALMIGGFCRVTLERPTPDPLFAGLGR